jgi:uncharacterized phage protein
MPSNAKVYNKSTQLSEPATKETCPRCSGFGAIFHDQGSCYLCNGAGKVWISSSGWTRALHKPLTDSILY